MAWVVWLVVAGVLAVAEAMTLTLVLAMLAGGAAAAAIAAAASAPGDVQGITFVVVSGALLGTAFPVARRHLTRGPTLRTGAAALVGRRAVTLERVDAHHGTVRLRGATWSARPYDEGLVIGEGVDVDVFAIEGATVLVHPVSDVPGVPGTGSESG